MTERTPEEARAIEERIEREVGEILQEHFANTLDRGYTHFSKVLAAKLIGRVWERLIEEDMEMSMVFDVPTRALLDPFTKRFEDHVMRWYHEQMATQRS